MKPIYPPDESSPRRRIIAGARRHFFALGLRGVTMDDLAEELGMSKKTLYAYFPSKTALVEAALHDKFDEIEAEMERIASGCSSDFPDALHQLIPCIHRHMEEIQPPFVRDMRREAPEIFKVVEGRRRDVIERYFGRFLNEGRIAGLVREDVPVRLIVEILLGAVQAILNPSKMAELDLTPDMGVPAIITVILEGVITGKGRPKT
jgi:AcrR family transcriptional regulator